MDNIKSKYIDYKDIIGEFGEERIQERLVYFMDAIMTFVKEYNTEEEPKLYLNVTVLRNMILDYFSDVLRLKSFHKITKINNIKRVSYEMQWFLREKPIQILSDDVEAQYANEKFAFQYIMHELVRGQLNRTLDEDSIKKTKAFAESLFYHLKFRDCDAKNLELMMIAYKAGSVFNQQDNNGEVSADYSGLED